MMNNYDTDLALATFRCGAADPNLFLVQGWQGHEGVSQLYRFEIDLASAKDDIDLEQILGSRATFTLRNEAGELIPWHGLITELHQTQCDETYAYYQAILEPQVALLSLFKQSRVYVESNTIGGGDPTIATIIRSTLKQCGLIEEASDSNSNSSAAQYEIRIRAADINATSSNFICQFEETTFDFLMRSLEQAGIYFWFEQKADQECLVFGNHIDQQPILKKKMFWRPAEGLNTDPSDIAINHFKHSLTVQPKGVVLRDFSVSQPNLNLTVQANVSEEAPANDRFNTFGSIEVYGGHYNKQAKGEKQASLRAEEIACQRSRYSGEAQSIGLYAGLFVEMQHHFRADFNRPYYVVSVQHSGKQSLPRQTTEQAADTTFYHAQFTALPATLQFRAPRKTTKPRIIGFISAIIMADGAGEYAEMNEHGCYKIQFLFAPLNPGQEEKANSAWVRMATPYAGSQHGMNFPLLKGTEVLVSFLSGNPDRPVIMAAIPNENNPSVRNEQNASQPVLRTAGQNALEFEDKAGQQYARLVSPKENTTLQLGANPENPAQTGIRLATGAHTGLTSSSYIQSVLGIFHQEIGQEGKVDLDPEPRLALNQLKDKKMADALTEQALLPNATPAQQVKAFEAKIRADDAEIAMLEFLLEKEKKKKNVDPDVTTALESQIKEVKEKSEKNANIVKKFTNQEISAEDLSPALANKSVEDKVKEKTTKESYKEVGHMGMETSYKKNAIVNSFFFGINNAFSFALDNSIFGGMKNSITLAGTLDFNAASGINVNANKHLNFNLTEAKEYTFFNKNEVAKELEITNIKSKASTLESELNTLSARDTFVDKKTTVKSTYTVTADVSYKLNSLKEISLGVLESKIEMDTSKIAISNAVSKIEVGSTDTKIQYGTTASIVLGPAGVTTKGMTAKIDATSIIQIG